MNILKFSRGVQNPSEETKMSVGMRLMIPDLELHHHALLLVIDGDWAADNVCWSNSDITSRSVNCPRKEREGGDYGAQQQVCYLWVEVPPTCHNQPETRAVGPTRTLSSGPRARVPCMAMGGPSAPSAEAVYSSIPSKDEYLLRTRVE
jgi:hypothetical protein